MTIMMINIVTSSRCKTEISIIDTKVLDKAEINQLGVILFSKDDRSNLITIFRFFHKLALSSDTEDDVFCFDVSVNGVVAMKLFQTAKNLRENNFGDNIGKTAVGVDEGEQIRGNRELSAGSVGVDTAFSSQSIDESSSINIIIETIFF